MSSPFSFDATAVAPRAEFTVLPNNNYRVQVTGFTRKTSQKGNDYISGELTVLDGEYANRKLWVNINFWHPDTDTRDRAHREMSDLCHAVGILTPTDLNDFIGKTLVAKVKVKRQADGSDQNQVTKYEKDAGPGALPAARVVQAGGIGATPKWAQPKPAA